MFFRSNDTVLQNDILSYQEGQYMKKSCNVLTFSWIGYSHFLGNMYNSVQSNKNLGVVVSSAAKVRNVVGIKPFQSLCTFKLLNDIQKVCKDVITITIILVIIMYNNLFLSQIKSDEVAEPGPAV